MDDFVKVVKTIMKITQNNNIIVSEAEKLLTDLKKKLSDFLKEYPYELYFNFDYEFTRFSEFVKFPDFAERNIIGIGGKFSSGKSSFLNALLDEKILPVDTTPTTSIPTFIGNGKEFTVVLNIFNNLIEIDKTDLKNLKHYNSEEIEYSFSHLLKKIFIKTQQTEYKNLVFLDTPGYSKGEAEAEDYSENTDKKIAKVQLNNSNFIIWLVDADNGTISKEDIDFLKSLNPEIEILIVVTKADKKQTEIDSILKYIKNEVSSKGLNVIDVLSFSARKKAFSQIDEIKKQIDIWNKNKIDVLFGKNFKLFFVELSDFFNTEEEELKKELNKLNRTLTLVDNNDVLGELNSLNQRVKIKLDKIKEKRKELEKLQLTFFKNIKKTASLTNINIPEPDEISFIKKKADFGGLLKEFKKKNNIKDSNLDLFFIKEFEFKEGVNFLKDVDYSEITKEFIGMNEINFY